MPPDKPQKSASVGQSDPNQIKTYRQLLHYLQNFVPDDRLDDNLAVDVLTHDGLDLETYSAAGSVFLDIALDDHDNLDPGHLVIVVEA